MPEPINATRVVILKEDGDIEGPPDHEIVMSGYLHGDRWSGELTIQRSIFEEHKDILTDGSLHKVELWENGEYAGSGEIKITGFRRSTSLVIPMPSSMEIEFEGPRPDLVE